jgi:transposase-like protein
MKFSKTEKAMWLEDWRRSGKPVWTYAKENGLIPQTFYRWAAQEKKTKQGFIEVPAPVVQSMQSPQYPHVILIEKADIKIRIPLDLHNVEFRAVMEGLKAALW